MEYYIKTKTIEEKTELENAIEVGNIHYHKGKDYRVNEIRIIEPNDGVIYLFCSEDKRGKKANLTVKVR